MQTELNTIATNNRIYRQNSRQLPLITADISRAPDTCHWHLTTDTAPETCHWHLTTETLLQTVATDIWLQTLIQDTCHWHLTTDTAPDTCHWHLTTETELQTVATDIWLQRHCSRHLSLTSDYRDTAPDSCYWQLITETALHTVTMDNNVQRHSSMQLPLTTVYRAQLWMVATANSLHRQSSRQLPITTNLGDRAPETCHWQQSTETLLQTVPTDKGLQKQSSRHFSTDNSLQIGSSRQLQLTTVYRDTAPDTCHWQQSTQSSRQIPLTVAYTDRDLVTWHHCKVVTMHMPRVHHACALWSSVS